MFSYKIINRLYPRFDIFASVDMFILIETRADGIQSFRSDIIASIATEHRQKNRIKMLTRERRAT